MTNNSPIEIFICEIKKRITFKIKTACYLEILISETMKFVRSTENKITKDKNEENVPHLEITEVILVYFNFVNNDDQQDSRILYTFVPYRSFDQLLEISQTNFIFLTTYDSQFSYIEVQITCQNSKQLEIEDKISLHLAIQLNLEVQYSLKVIHFNFFLKIWVKSINKNLSGKYSQKRLDSATRATKVTKKSELAKVVNDAFKTV